MSDKTIVVGDMAMDQGLFLEHAEAERLASLVIGEPTPEKVAHAIEMAKNDNYAFAG